MARERRAPSLLVRSDQPSIGVILEEHGQEIVRYFRTLLREVYSYFLTHSILERYAEIRRQLRPPHGPERGSPEGAKPPFEYPLG